MPCIGSFYIKNKTPFRRDQQYIQVPCNKCPECIRRRASQWIFRLKQEDKISTSAYFVTLTYDPQYVPITPNGFMTLDKPEVQRFFKRLRKAHPNVKLKYYLAAEYGSTYKRPHYHIILFNADEKLIAPNWQLGYVDIASVSGASIGYVTGYINKGKIIPEHKRDDRQPEFSLMSKGLGQNYLNEDTIRYHHEDPDRFYVVESGNSKISMPRYYRDKIYTEQQRESYAKTILPIIDQQEQQRIRDYILRFGSLDGYTRSKEEAIKQRYENHFKKENLKRGF